MLKKQMPGVRQFHSSSLMQEQFHLKFLLKLGHGNAQTWL